MEVSWCVKYTIALAILTPEYFCSEMITVSTEAEVDSNSDNVLDDGELVHGPNVIIVKRI